MIKPVQCDSNFWRWIHSEPVPIRIGQTSLGVDATNPVSYLVYTFQCESMHINFASIDRPKEGEDRKDPCQWRILKHSIVELPLWGASSYLPPVSMVGANLSTVCSCDESSSCSIGKSIGLIDSWSLSKINMLRSHNVNFKLFQCLF